MVCLSLVGSHPRQPDLLQIVRGVAFHRDGDGVSSSGEVDCRAQIVQPVRELKHSIACEPAFAGINTSWLHAFAIPSSFVAIPIFVTEHAGCRATCFTFAFTVSVGSSSSCTNSMASSSLNRSKRYRFSRIRWGRAVLREYVQALVSITTGSLQWPDHRQSRSTAAFAAIACAHRQPWFSDAVHGRQEFTNT